MGLRIGDLGLGTRMYGVRSAQNKGALWARGIHAELYFILHPKPEP